MAIPDYQALMLPVLKLASEGETTVPGALERIANGLGLSAEDREAMLPSGKQRVLHNRAHWAKFYLTKAGLLQSTGRGKFAITPAGAAALHAGPDQITTKDLLKYPAFREFYGKADQPVSTETASEAPRVTPEEIVEAAYSAMLVALSVELLDRIMQNSPLFFEQVIVDLLVSMGYGGSRSRASERLGKSGDGGVDGVINEDLLGLDRIYVQAKRYAAANTIGRPEIQAFTGSLVGFGATKGVFVTTSSFSAQAREFASRIPQRVVLIDGQTLTALMIEHRVGVRSTRTIDFMRLDEDFFSEE